MFKFLGGRAGAILGLIVGIGGVVANAPDAVGHGAASVAAQVAAGLGVLLAAFGKPAHKPDEQ